VNPQLPLKLEEIINRLLEKIVTSVTKAVPICAAN
jgi:hypothetical protein